MNQRPSYREMPWSLCIMGICLIAVAMLGALTILHGFACWYGVIDFSPVMK